MGRELVDKNELIHIFNEYQSSCLREKSTFPTGNIYFKFVYKLLIVITFVPSLVKGNT